MEYVTDNITQYINYTKDDVLGKDIYNIIHHGDHNTFMPTLLPVSLGRYISFRSKIRSYTIGSWDLIVVISVSYVRLSQAGPASRSLKRGIVLSIAASW